MKDPCAHEVIFCSIGRIRLPSQEILQLIRQRRYSMQNVQKRSLLPTSYHSLTGTGNVQRNVQEDGAVMKLRHLAEFPTGMILISQTRFLAQSE
jgi:hypothetical protein